MNNDSISKEKLESLYNSGNSMADISKRLRCSIHKVTYWMDKYNIPKRNHSDASYIKQNPDGDPFNIKQNLSVRESTLYGLGLGIYMGEGEKVSKHAVRVANTDPLIIKTFIRFLLDICNLKKQKLSYSIVCFNDTHPEVASSYWSKILGTSREKFGKIVQIPPQGKGKYRRKSKFGVCTVTASNIKLKRWLMEELGKINIYADIV